jgi:hypothetical protein
MPVRSSGSLGLEADIVNEFGGERPHSISEYYRGGTLVANSNLNINIPTSGQISFSDFYNSSKFFPGSINITARNTNTFAQDAIAQEAGLQPAVSGSWQKYFFRTFQGFYISDRGIGTTITTPNMTITIRGDEDERLFASNLNTGIRNPGVELVYRAARFSTEITEASYRGSGQSVDDDSGLLAVSVTGGTYTANRVGYYTYRWVADVFSQSISRAPINLFQGAGFTSSFFGVASTNLDVGSGWG